MRTAIKLMTMAIIIVCSTSSYAQTRNYRDGSAWQISQIKSETGQGVAYLNSLKTTWKAIMDEAKTQGLILSYKILSGASSNPNDWDILLMVEYKNLAAMEGNEEKWEAIQTKVVGSDDAQGKLRDSRINMRSIYGMKVLKEVVYK